MPVLPNQPINSSSGSTNFGSQAINAVVNTASGVIGVNPFNARVDTGQMFAYTTSGPGGSQTVGPYPIVSFPHAAYDWRVRVSLPPGSTYFYNDPTNALLMPLITSAAVPSNPVGNQVINRILAATRVGVVFPYTPTLQVTHTANYTAQKLTHNNYTQYYYDNSEVQSINVSGEFTVQNITEGQYLLATIYFLRSVTKMFFGKDPLAGNPPPIVYLNGYGQYYLPNVPCVVTSFQHTMPDSVDYVEIPEPGLMYGINYLKPIGNTTRLPTTSTVSLTLQPVYSRLSQSQKFSLQDFARGALVNSPGSALPTSAYGATQLPIKGGKQGSGGFL